jgi:hypothetical protein
VAAGVFHHSIHLHSSFLRVDMLYSIIPQNLHT